MTAGGLVLHLAARLVALMAVWLCCVCLDAAAAASVEQSLAVDGRTRTYRLHGPGGGPRSNVPLVLALHGGFGNGGVMERLSGFSELADRAGFIVAYPNGSSRFERVLAWNAGRCCGEAQRRNSDDTGFLVALIDHLVATRGVDPRRVYVTGMSNGAMMAHRLAAERPDKVAALAAVAGGLETEPSVLRGAVPLLQINGTADDHVPYRGGGGSRSLAGVAFAPVAATIAAWVKVNHATPVAHSEALPDIVDDGTRVVRHVYAATQPGAAAVVLYEIVGGGHTWPGRVRGERLFGTVSQDISATEVIWQFFANHRRQ